jgi:hypothetical protein
MTDEELIATAARLRARADTADVGGYGIAPIRPAALTAAANMIEARVHAASYSQWHDVARAIDKFAAAYMGEDTHDER